MPASSAACSGRRMPRLAATWISTSSRIAFTPSRSCAISRASGPRAAATMQNSVAPVARVRLAASTSSAMSSHTGRTGEENCPLWLQKWQSSGQPPVFSDTIPSTSTPGPPPVSRTSCPSASISPSRSSGSCRTWWICACVSRSPRSSTCSRATATMSFTEPPFRWGSDLPVPSGPVRGAQGPLEYLPAGRARQRLDDVDGARALVVREALAGERDDLGSGHLLAGPEHDERLDALAPLVIGHADHRDLGHRRVLGHGLLDLGRVDVLPAGDDHVLDPVRDEQEAAVVHVPDVAAAQPARRGDRRRGVLRPVQVAHHPLGRTEPELARLPGRDIAPSGRGP